MNIYGKIAQAAVLHCQKKSADPAKAWDIAAKAGIPHSVSMQRKSCPRSAFLGLCSAGEIRDVPSGEFLHSSKNGAHALKAVELLRSDKSLAADRNALWQRVVKGGTAIKHNGQLDVVLALWHGKMLKGS